MVSPNKSYSVNVPELAEKVALATFTGLPNAHPSSDFPVVQKVDGAVISRYGDFVWDWSYYNPTGRKCFFNLSPWKEAKPNQLNQHQLALIDEIRWLMFVSIWKNKEQIIGFKNLNARLGAFRHLARYAFKKETTIQSILSSDIEYISYLSNVGLASLILFQTAMAFLYRLGKNEFGYRVAFNEVKGPLAIRINELKNDEQQHAILPTRIYSRFINNLFDRLDRFEPVADQFLKLTYSCCHNKLLGRRRDTQLANSKKHNIKRGQELVQFPSLLKRYGLTEYFTVNQMAEDSKSLYHELSEVQKVCKYVIHVFSGMRDGEVTDLPFYCLEVAQENCRAQYTLHGYTTKFNFGRRADAVWVTSVDAERAVVMAQKIARIVYKLVGDLPQKSKADRGKYPLFRSLTDLGLGGRSSVRINDRHPAANLELTTNCSLRHQLQPIITEDDIVELERFDGRRKWREEKEFQIGMPWHVKTHQLRRSIAVYAHRSGIVSLPSLRRQLQHITLAMTRYYARGSNFANNFVVPGQGHFAEDWIEAEAESHALGYINKVNSDITLFGGHGQFVEVQIRKKNILLDRTQTIRLVARGEMAYTENAFGGCTKPGTCERNGPRLMNTTCVIEQCKFLLGETAKLDKVIMVKKNFALTLDSNSIEFRMENAEIEALVAARAREKQISR